MTPYVRMETSQSHWSSTFFNHPHSAWIFRTTRISDHDWITWPMPKVVSGHGSRVTSSWSARDPLAFSLAHVSQSAWKRLADRVQSQPRHLKMASCHGVWGLPWLVGTSKWIGLVFFLWVEMVVYTIQNGICGVNSWVVCWGNSIGEWLAKGLILAGNEGHMKYRTTVFAG